MSVSRHWRAISAENFRHLYMYCSRRALRKSRDIERLSIVVG